MQLDEAIAAAMQDYVDAGQLAGIATLVWRDGAVQTACVGARDIVDGLPVERDTIFRIASMTKPITSLAALLLVEEGRIGLDDPIAQWASEFTCMQVLRSPTARLEETVPAARAITIRDLLTHRSGLTYADFQSGPIAAAYAAQLGTQIDNDLTPDAWIVRLAGLPLLDQPGVAFNYGHSTDLLGLLIARIEDRPLGEVLQRRIFGPLGMVDTGFVVPAAARHRCAAPHGFDAAGRLIRRTTVPGSHARPERPAGMGFASGGQGLWSTLDDYLAFARLFIGGGAVDGVRLLRPETMALLMSNTLSPGQRTASHMFGLPLFAAGHGFGLGVAVVLESDRAAPTICGGQAGSVGWPGAYGGWWQADPSDNSVLIFLTHNMVELEQLAGGIGLGAYAAITQFQALASAPGR